MRKPIPSLFVCTLLFCAAAPAAPSAPIDFDRDIRPIFAQNCYECHGPDKAKAGLRLNDPKVALSELKSGNRAIIPNEPAKSELLRRVKSTDPDEQMPPKGDRLTPLQIEKLHQWIEQGAKWQIHWSYRPITRPDPPPVKNAPWPRTPIDNFILQPLERQNLAPSPPADPYTLIKRLHYDLLGLPPTLAEADEFAANPSDAAYEKLIDHLLASPHFGERWGRHWLDKARYADSDGYEKDSLRPDAWKYRDWVIDAFNRDLPFDQFTIQQLAGDLLPNATDNQKLATAFHRQTLTNKEGGVDPEQFRIEAVFDRVETTGAVWLGLTVGCARCHTHKYDAITQREYYQLFAFFNNADETEIKLPTSPAAFAKYEKEMQAYRPKLAALESQISNLKSQIDTSMPAWAVDLQQIIDALSLRHISPKDDSLQRTQQAWERNDPRFLSLQKDLADLQYDAPRPSMMLVRVLSQREKNPRPTHLLTRGDFLRPDQPLTPATLSILHPLNPHSAPSTQHSALSSAHSEFPSRLDLAHWLTDPSNPLTPRVAVNDIWLHLFGQALVRTPNDFGVRGEKPTHPQLLDFLATEFRRLNFSRKALIKEILLSSTYRQSSRLRPELLELDPENRLLHRQNRFRVEGEIVSDLTLSASALLAPKIGGPSVFPPMPPDVAALSYANNFQWKPSTGEDRHRRAMYTFFKRTAPHPNLTTFDCPDSNATTISRTTSHTPLQALATLNNEIFAEAAQSLSKRILTANHETPNLGTDAQKLQFAFRLCAIRPADSQELTTLTNLLNRSRAWYNQNPTDAKLTLGKLPVPNISLSEQAAWTSISRVLLNLDEFLTRE
ncbi:MAG TPA: PSD1 and planctomycete cytochrome C domain-containing protein [Tepidisphaeraceae bacterium]|nr:PSD1 and planctomycete cytochrome C domain-containing protein [Tepidisphaeraceae bacterium]